MIIVVTPSHGVLSHNPALSTSTMKGEFARGRLQRRNPYPLVRRGATNFNAPSQDVSKTSLGHDLIQLPNEILELIVCYIVPDVEFGVMEGSGYLGQRQPASQKIAWVAGLSPGAQQVWDEREDTRNLAMTCRRFPPIVERLMYKHISLPQTPICTCCAYPQSALPYLVRTLVERPDLARRVQTLDVWMRDRRLVKNVQEPLLCADNSYHECVIMAVHHLHNIKTTADEWINWGSELLQYQEVAMHAVLITLLPRLQDLKLYSPLAKLGLFTHKDAMGRERQMPENPDYSFLDVALRNSPIKSVYMGAPFPVTQFPSATLTTMEIDVVFFMDRSDWLQENTREVFPFVHSLSVVLNLPILRDSKLDEYITEVDVRVALSLFLRDMVPNMINFAITSPRGKLAFSPTEENCTDPWGVSLLSTIAYQDMHEDIEVNPLDDEWNDSSAWDWLLFPLEPVKDRLRELKVPLSWYSSNGCSTQPMRSLQDFERLEVLELPRVAVIANPYGDGYDESEHECLAKDFLPRALRRLVVSQVDVQTCAWVQEAFEYKKRVFPNWTQVEFRFRDDYSAVLSYGFEVAAKEAGIELVAAWRGQVETIVER
jgi:hypothetical protein